MVLKVIYKYNLYKLEYFPLKQYDRKIVMIIDASI